MRELVLNILVAEHHPAHAELIEEAFEEIAERRFPHPWIPRFVRQFALDEPSLLDALESGAIHVVLLGPSFAGQRVLRTVIARAPDVPVVAILDAADSAQGTSYVRQGAQDYMLASEIDWEPLARILRCSYERHQVSMAFRSLSLQDDLTGAYNLRGLIHAGERDWATAQEHGWSIGSLLISIPESAIDSDLAAVQTAEKLRRLLPASQALARIGPRLFASLALAPNLRESSRVWESASAAFGREAVCWYAEASAADADFAAFLDRALLETPLERASCDNSRFANRAGRNL